MFLFALVCLHAQQPDACILDSDHVQCNAVPISNCISQFTPCLPQLGLATDPVALSTCTGAFAAGSVLLAGQKVCWVAPLTNVQVHCLGRLNEIWNSQKAAVCPTFNRYSRDNGIFGNSTVEVRPLCCFCSLLIGLSGAYRRSSLISHLSRQICNFKKSTNVTRASSYLSQQA